MDREGNRVSVESSYSSSNSIWLVMENLIDVLLENTEHPVLDPEIIIDLLWDLIYEESGVRP